jgi:hypothetical protein
MEIPVLGFIQNLILSAVLALILSSIYVRYGNSLSNRRLFSRNFLLITMTTMLIISIVKSSLALSLGLVGALSIIRFRAAIKEPEELAYLFLAIGIGLGFGANQGTITVVAFAIITVITILVSKFSHKTYENQNLNLTVISHNPPKIGVDKIIDILSGYCSAVNLRRLDETKEIVEASFLVEFRNFKQLNKAKIALQQLDDSLKFSFLDSKGIY